MQHLDDGTIHAWLDGALGLAQAQHVEAHVAACRACADRVAEARGLIAASSRILTALDDVPANVVPAEQRIAAAAHVALPAVAAASPPDHVVAPRSRWWGHRYGRLAAVLAFVVAGTLVLTREANRRDVAMRRETPRATEELRAQRDSTVPSANAPAAAPRVAPQARPAPSAALGGASPSPAPAPALKPQVKSFAQEARQQAAAAKKEVADANARTFGDANKVADTVRRAAQASSTLARRVGAGGRLQLSEVIVTGQAIAPPPRLVSIDSVQRGGVLVRRQTYAVGSGTRVVLETTPASAMPDDSTAAAPVGTRTDSAASDSSSTAMHSIHWRGADGTGYTLSGPMSVEDLQRIRAALGKN